MARVNAAPPRRSAAAAAAAATAAAAASGRSTVERSSEMATPEQSVLSEYERQRLQNIRENQAKLVALGLPDAKPTPRAKRKAPVTPAMTEPRKSARAAVPSQDYSDAAHSRSPSHRRKGASSSAASGGHAPARSVSGVSAVEPRTPATDIVAYEAGEEWMVEAILEQRAGCAGEIEYLVKWQQWTEEHNTWEPEANLGGCVERLTAFHASASAAAGPDTDAVLDADADAGNDANAHADAHAAWEEAQKLRASPASPIAVVVRPSLCAADVYVLASESATLGACLLHTGFGVRVEVSDGDRTWALDVPMPLPPMSDLPVKAACFVRAGVWKLTWVLPLRRRRMRMVACSSPRRDLPKRRA